ncbi:MAG: hypothetical protein ABMA64_41820 [Myxococcota bacterium]
MARSPDWLQRAKALLEQLHRVARGLVEPEPEPVPVPVPVYVRRR